MTVRKRATFGKDKWRKHRHWKVTVFYKDGERFARLYTDREKGLWDRRLFTVRNQHKLGPKRRQICYCVLLNLVDLRRSKTR
jgi:hypothetical protein